MSENSSFEKWCSEKGLTFAAIADEFGLHRGTVARWAQNRVPVERVPELQKRFGMPPEVALPDIFASGPDGAPK